MLGKLGETLAQMSAEKGREDAEKSDPEKLPDGNSGSGTTYGYQVQARYMYSAPKSFEGMILDKQWRTIPFKEGACGVPAGSRFEMPELVHAYCYSHEAAQALRWWFLANAHASDFSSICLETRLIEYKLEYSHKATAVRVVDYIERSAAPRPAPQTDREHGD